MQRTKMEAAQQSRWSEDTCSGVGRALMPKSVQARKAGLGRLPSGDGWLMLEKGWDLVGDMQRGLYCLQRILPCCFDFKTLFKSDKTGETKIRLTQKTFLEELSLAAPAQRCWGLARRGESLGTAMSMGTRSTGHVQSAQSPHRTQKQL